ncbi:hypothetical protein LEMLEM_LOCUS5085 [Lemmus lemmus]
MRKHIGGQTFRCTVCNKDYSRLDNLRQHQRRHHPALEPISPGSM